MNFMYDLHTPFASLYGVPLNSEWFKWIDTGICIERRETAFPDIAERQNK
jgi:hypothetical protein